MGLLTFTSLFHFVMRLVCLYLYSRETELQLYANLQTEYPYFGNFMRLA